MRTPKAPDLVQAQTITVTPHPETPNPNEIRGCRATPRASRSAGSDSDRSGAQPADPRRVVQGATAAGSARGPVTRHVESFTFQRTTGAARASSAQERPWRRRLCNTSVYHHV